MKSNKPSSTHVFPLECPSFISPLQNTRSAQLKELPPLARNSLKKQIYFSQISRKRFEPSVHLQPPSNNNIELQQSARPSKTGPIPTTKKDKVTVIDRNNLRNYYPQSTRLLPPPGYDPFQLQVQDLHIKSQTPNKSITRTNSKQKQEQTTANSTATGSPIIFRLRRNRSLTKNASNPESSSSAILISPVDLLTFVEKEEWLESKNRPAKVLPKHKKKNETIQQEEDDFDLMPTEISSNNNNNTQRKLIEPKIIRDGFRMLSAGPGRKRAYSASARTHIKLDFTFGRIL